MTRSSPISNGGQCATTREKNPPYMIIINSWLCAITFPVSLVPHAHFFYVTISMYCRLSAFSPRAKNQPPAIRKADHEYPVTAFFALPPGTGLVVDQVVNSPAHDIAKRRPPRVVARRLGRRRRRALRRQSLRSGLRRRRLVNLGTGRRRRFGSTASWTGAYRTVCVPEKLLGGSAPAIVDAPEQADLIPVEACFQPQRSGASIAHFYFQRFIVAEDSPIVVVVEHERNA